jgi:hypothetical protein
MIKFLVNGRNGAQLVGLGLSQGNIDRLKDGKPIYIHLDELGIEGIDVLIHYGETEDSIIADFKKEGLIPDDKV